MSKSKNKQTDSLAEIDGGGISFSIEREEGAELMPIADISTTLVAFRDLLKSLSREIENVDFAVRSFNAVFVACEPRTEKPAEPSSQSDLEQRVDAIVTDYETEQGHYETDLLLFELVKQYAPDHVKEQIARLENLPRWYS